MFAKQYQRLIESFLGKEGQVAFEKAVNLSYGKGIFKKPSNRKATPSLLNLPEGADHPNPSEGWFRTVWAIYFFLTGPLIMEILLKAEKDSRAIWTRHLKPVMQFLQGMDEVYASLGKSGKPGMNLWDQLTEQFFLLDEQALSKGVRYKRDHVLRDMLLRAFLPILKAEDPGERRQEQRWVKTRV